VIGFGGLREFRGFFEQLGPKQPRVIE
jgi:hypothetical protein